MSQPSGQSSAQLPYRKHRASNALLPPLTLLSILVYLCTAGANSSSWHVPPYCLVARSFGDALPNGFSTHSAMARNASRSPSSATGGLTHSLVSVVAPAGSRHPRLIAYTVTGHAAAAAILIRAVVSGLRHQHMLRASIKRENPCDL
eukprot:6017478-Amphidinium_carterae.1